MVEDYHRPMWLPEIPGHLGLELVWVKVDFVNGPPITLDPSLHDCLASALHSIQRQFPRLKSLIVA
jgi:hypothetical protein